MAALARAGMLDPRFVAAAAAGAARWGVSPAAGVAANARRVPSRPAVIDERGAVSYRQLDQWTAAVAWWMRDRGLAGRRLGVLCRNHRGYPLAVVGAAKAGCDLVHLNTGFAAPQLAEVLGREGVDVVIADGDLVEVVDAAVAGGARLAARVCTDPVDDRPGWDTLEGIIAAGPHTDPPRPGRAPGVTILTSGTTGTPKGARREQVRVGLTEATALFQVVPVRVDDTVVCPAPLFHSLGNAALLAGLTLGHTLVLRRRFDAEATMRAVDEHAADGMVVVPVMLQRILALPPDVLGSFSGRSLRWVLCSGSALSGDLALRWMDRFGDNLYNLYGSTEVAMATIATPADLRAAPGTAGPPVPGVTVRLYDHDDRPVPPGERGRIFVGSSMAFDGYTGGGGKASIDGLLEIGDVGRFDDAGRLFVEGRADDMIVSGGENVYPREVEDLLARHPDVAEAAVVGVDDPEWGQRLVAYVVPAPGACPDPEELRRHVRSELAAFKVPREVVVVPELPRNPTGKVLRRELRSRAGADGPGP